MLTVDETATPPGTAWLVLRVSSAGAMLFPTDDLGKVRARSKGHLWVPVGVCQGVPEMAARLLGAPKLPLLVPLDEAAERFDEMEIHPEALGWVFRAWRKLDLDGRCLLGMWFAKVAGTEPRPWPKVAPKPYPPPPSGYRFRATREGRCPSCAQDYQAGEQLRMFGRKPRHEACASRAFRELTMIRRQFAGV